MIGRPPCRGPGRVHRRRWTTSVTPSTEPGVAPTLRLQMARLFAALDASEMHGIVVASRVDITP